jgi:hypothetical protein
MVCREIRETHKYTYTLWTEYKDSYIEVGGIYNDHLALKGIYMNMHQMTIL